MSYICEKELMEIYKNIEAKLKNYGIKTEIALMRDYLLKVQLIENEMPLGKLIVDYSPKKRSHGYRKDSDLSQHQFERILDLLGEKVPQKLESSKVNTGISNASSEELSRIRYHAYVDGSFIDGCIGYGAVILDRGNIVAELSGAVESPDALNSRQVGGEIQAVIEVLKWCRENNISEIAIFYDFLNIEKWATGEYTASISMTQAYKKYIDESNVSITWVKVESHTGVAFNERADELAKNGAKKGRMKIDAASGGVPQAITPKNITGWIVYNGSLSTPKFTEHVDWFVKAAGENDVKLVPYKNDELGPAVIDGKLRLIGFDESEKPDFVIFWDKDVRLAFMLEKMGFKLFNGSEAVRICDDKILTHQVLADYGIPMPKTISSPLVFPGCNVDEELFIEKVERVLSYPIVVKEAFGSFGAQVYLAKDRDELLALRKRLIDVPHLYQEFIESSYGRSVRMQVVGDEVTAAMLCISDGDFRSNVTRGGRMMPFYPPKAFKDLAIKAVKLIGAHFAGVDLLFDKDESPILCEINSNAHIKNLSNCTGVDVADCIVRYIKGTIGRTK